ncbi:MAG: cob(I)yrinic acid a,c-diamide adenosyltransferase [Nitrospiraceae bacterium]|nr:cob(I)yrinic acid a,c-diamide adenosyltransferase [Nitrospiraceae bacterium]
MGISTKKGDDGYTGTLGGERVPKYHIVTEAVGNVDEANSLLGLARASSKEKRTKRILLQVQKHLFIIGAELSTAGGHGKTLRKEISPAEVVWLEKLIDDMEEALALPPGFVAFGGEECSAKLDVARTAVRKAERTAVKMSGEKLIERPFVLKYLNRLSDLLFVLACYEEKSSEDRRRIGHALLRLRFSDPAMRRFAIFAIAVIFILVVVIILVLMFHRPVSDTMKHMQEMGVMLR